MNVAMKLGIVLVVLGTVIGVVGTVGKAIMSAKTAITTMKTAWTVLSGAFAASCRVGGHRNCCIGGSVRPSMEQVRGIQELLDRLI